MHYIKSLFVPLEIAIQLKAAGFNEPCLAMHEYLEWEGHIRQTFILSSLLDGINYHYANEISVHPAPPPELSLSPKTNSELPGHLFSAPIYQQVFDWLESKGYRVHDCWVTPTKKYAVMLYDMATGKLIWPDRSLNAIKDVNEFSNKVDGWHIAIEQALKHINK